MTGIREILTGIQQNADQFVQDDSGLPHCENPTADESE